METAPQARTDDDAAQPEKSPLITRSRMLAAALALGGMVVGSVVGLGVQKGVESTGLLGPSVQQLIAEQQSNLSEVSQKLDSLRTLSTDPEVRKSLADLGKLLERQGELSRHANAELGYLSEQVTALKEQQLAAAGFAGGADFWLKAGESVNVGGPGQVFGLLAARGGFADVNLNGARKRLYVGDTVDVSAEDGSCTVFYKLATPRTDGRIGFDLSCG